MRFPHTLLVGAILLLETTPIFSQTLDAAPLYGQTPNASTADRNGSARKTHASRR